MAKKQKDMVKATLSRGLSVPIQEAVNFPFDHIDLLIAQNMLSGVVKAHQLADELGIRAEVIQHRLMDPVRCAWLSNELRKAVETRLGNVIAAVYSRAVNTGDPAAAKMLLSMYKQFEAPVQKHLHMHTDLTNLTDDQLDMMIKQKQRQLNIKDAEYTTKDGDGDE